MPKKLAIFSLLLCSLSACVSGDKKDATADAGTAKATFADPGPEAIEPTPDEETKPEKPKPSDPVPAGRSAELSWTKLTPAQAARIEENKAYSFDRGRNSSSSADESYSLVVGLTYDQVFGGLSSVVKATAPSLCHLAGLGHKPGAYDKKEVPCGSIVNKDWKSIAQLDVERIGGRLSFGPEYRFSRFGLKVLLGRKNHSGTYTEESLTDKKAVRLNSSKELGEDISIRYRPEGASGRLDLCLNIPGTDVSGTRVRVKGSVWEEAFGIRTSLGAEMVVDPGYVTYDYARFCVSSRAGIDPKTTEPFLELSEIQAPHVENARLTGMKIQIRDLWAQIADQVIRWFGVNLRTMAVKAAKGYVDDINENDMRNGRWLVQLSAGLVGKPLAAEMRSKLVERLTNKEVPMTSIKLRKRLVRQCKLLKMLDLELPRFREIRNWTREQCEDVFSSIDIALQPFAPNEQSRAKGCYDYFANIHETKGNPWWAKECRFESRMMVRITKPLLPRTAEIRDLIWRLMDDSAIPSDLRKLMNDRGISLEEVLDQVEELESRGKFSMDALRNQL